MNASNSCIDLFNRSNLVKYFADFAKTQFGHYVEGQLYSQKFIDVEGKEATRTVFITNRRVEVAGPKQEVYFGLIKQGNQQQIVVVRVPENLVINIVSPVIVFSFKENISYESMQATLSALTNLNSRKPEQVLNNTFMFEKPGLRTAKIYEFLDAIRDQLNFIHIPVSERFAGQLFPAERLEVQP